jgi:DNA polymerase-3 subunit gamma/tau
MGHIAAHDTAAALALFSSLYADGKDISAMADELSSLARDLLVLKTAPQSGQAMLSGVATGQETQALLAQFTGAELLRIVTLLQQTTGSFARSANRRIDFELCLMQLCSPALANDPQSLSARISRVEDAIAGGTITVQTAPAPAPAQDDAPPPWDDDDIPPEPDVPQSTSQAAPAPTVSDGFWVDLMEKVKADAGPEFALYKDSITGAVSGDVLTLTASSDIIKTQLERDKLPELFRQKASLLLGSPVRVRVVTRGASASGADPLDDLIRRSSQLGGVVDIH